MGGPYYIWKDAHVNMALKCHYYGFLKMIFHAALSEWKHPAEF